MKKLKSLIAILLVLVLAVSNLPMQVLAVSVINNGDGKCAHIWMDADCENPATCFICGAIDGEALGHDWQEISCEEPKYCPICGMFEGEPLGHKMGDWVTVKEATCTTDGEIRTSCARCDYYEKETLLKEGHKYTETAVVEATCEEKGYTTYTCNVCNDSYTDHYVKELGHKWNEAGCTEPKYCLVCGATEEMPLGHNFGKWVIISEATCTVDGEMRRDCSRCDYYENEPIPASGHIDMAVVTEPTCTQKGYTTHACSICKDSYIDSYVDALGHKWQEASCQAPKYCLICNTAEGMPLEHKMGNWITLSDATCTTDGKMRRKCDLCNYSEQGDIPAKGHTDEDKNYICDACGKDLCTEHQPKTVIGKDATCTETGLTDGKSCAICGDVLEAQKVIPAKDHSWKNATCTEPKNCEICGITSGSAKGHDWAAGNCTTPKKCKTCGTTTGDVVHNYASQYDYKCDDCGATRTVDMTRPMVDMFRMYDPNSGEHFYTGSVIERQNLIDAGWNYEGVGFTFPLTTGDPVHRLYEPVTGEHLYTMDVNEMNALLAAGWNYEGIAFNSGFENEVPQYRLHNPNATRGAYHFTASQEEKDVLIAAGWEYQGIGWYSLGA